METKTIIKGKKELLGFQFVSLLCNFWDNDIVRLYKANSNHLIKCNSDLTVEKLQVIQNSKQGHPELILCHPVCQLSWNSPKNSWKQGFLQENFRTSRDIKTWDILNLFGFHPSTRPETKKILKHVTFLRKSVMVRINLGLIPWHWITLLVHVSLKWS